MADSDVTKPEDSAEKAYAAAAESIIENATPPIVAPAVVEPVMDDGGEPVEFPAKPTRARKPRADAEVAAEPVAVEPAIAPAVKLAPKPRGAAKPAKAIKATAKSAPKLAVKRAAAKPAPVKLRKASVQKIKTAPKAALKTLPKTVKASIAAAPKIPFITKIKEIPMDVTTSIKDAVSGAQEKAKQAFTKTSATATEYSEFAKGNVEAFVESGKILASGLQEMGTKFVADGKSAFETATADVKALSSVKSPTDFFKFQTDLLRRNFDSAVAYGSKTSEAMLKLTNEVIAPISGRVSLAIEKVKKAA